MMSSADESPKTTAAASKKVDVPPRDRVDDNAHQAPFSVGELLRQRFAIGRS